MKHLIMHGSYTKIDNPKYWFNWLKKELVNLGGSVISDQFPTEDWSEVEDLDSNKASTFISKQSLISWENKFITDILPQLGSEPFVFIGHSMAPLFILHMLQKYNFKLAGAIFVAPFFNVEDRPEIWQFYPTNKTFYNYDFDFTKIKSQILGKTYVVYGDNDPYVPASESPLFAEKLGSELIVVANGGHCGSIFKEFPLVLNLSSELL